MSVTASCVVDEVTLVIGEVPVAPTYEVRWPLLHDVDPTISLWSVPPPQLAHRSLPADQSGRRGVVSSRHTSHTAGPRPGPYSIPLFGEHTSDEVGRGTVEVLARPVVAPGRARVGVPEKVLYVTQ